MYKKFSASPNNKKLQVVFGSSKSFRGEFQKYSQNQVLLLFNFKNSLSSSSISSSLLSFKTSKVSPVAFWFHQRLFQIQTPSSLKPRIKSLQKDSRQKN
jgi:hypothetical protein